MKNKILSIHAQWLWDNEYYDEAIDCGLQAKEYSKEIDLRQIKFEKTYPKERTVE